MASVTRRIVRNNRQRETGRRNPTGKGRLRGMTPDQRAAYRADERARLQREHEKKIARGLA